MLDVTLSIMALIAGGVALEVFTAARASLNEAVLPWCAEPNVLIEETQTGNPS